MAIGGSPENTPRFRRSPPLVRVVRVGASTKWRLHEVSVPFLPRRRDGATAVIEDEYGSYRMYTSSGTNLGRGTVKIGSKLHGAVTVPKSA